MTPYRTPGRARSPKRPAGTAELVGRLFALACGLLLTGVRLVGGFVRHDPFQREQALAAGLTACFAVGLVASVWSLARSHTSPARKPHPEIDGLTP